MDYHHIDNCVNLLYDCIYAAKPKCFTLKYPSKNDIQFHQIKREFDNDYFDTNFSLLWKYDDILVLNRNSKTTYNTMIKIRKYEHNSNDENDINSKEATDMKINYLLSEHALFDTHKYILFPIFNMDVKLKDLKDTKLKTIIKENLNINDDDILCVQGFENYYKTISLKEYLDKNIISMNNDKLFSLFFEILYIMHKIQYHYPSFRHGNLNLDTIYVLLTDVEKQKYIFENTVYELPTNVLVKFTNFYDGYINDVAENKSISNKLKKSNHLYDIISIFFEIYKYLDSKNSNNSETIAFFNYVLPKPLLTEKECKQAKLCDLSTTMDITIGSIIVRNNFFVNFIEENNIYNMAKSRTVKRTAKNTKDHAVSLTESSINHPLTLARNVSYERDINSPKRSQKKTINDFGLTTVVEEDEIVYPEERTRRASSTTDTSNTKMIEEPSEEDEEIDIVEEGKMRQDDDSTPSEQDFSEFAKKPYANKNVSSDDTSDDDFSEFAKREQPSKPVMKQDEVEDESPEDIIEEGKKHRNPKNWNIFSVVDQVAGIANKYGESIEVPDMQQMNKYASSALMQQGGAILYGGMYGQMNGGMLGSPDMQQPVTDILSRQDPVYYLQQLSSTPFMNNMYVTPEQIKQAPMDILKNAQGVSIANSGYDAPIVSDAIASTLMPQVQQMQQMQQMPQMPQMPQMAQMQQMPQMAQPEMQQSMPRTGTGNGNAEQVALSSDTLRKMQNQLGGRKKSQKNKFFF